MIHMTVRQSIAYGLKLTKRPPEENDQRVAEIRALVRLGELAERVTPEIAGGQQRVALARALVMRPLTRAARHPRARSSCDLPL